MSETEDAEFYQALIEKNAAYDGVFFVGVTTTGIFCHPTCPARKPKPENCLFFAEAQQALLAGFRPCKRCQPLSHPNRETEIVRQLVAAVEAQPDKKWRQADVRALHVDPSTVRRQFQKRFGMTFIEYARARRLGLAVKHIRAGTSVIDAQISAGYTSGSGFRDAFERVLGDVPSRLDAQSVMKASWIDTPLGPMIAIATDDYLYLLEFVDRRGLETEIAHLRCHEKAAIVPGDALPLRHIRDELRSYFAGQFNTFETAIKQNATAFQARVWAHLQTIPYGETRSYAQVAAAIGQPTAARAIARANGANRLALVVPCHRVISSSGDLAGYGGGISRKRWLLDQEKANGKRYE